MEKIDQDFVVELAVAAHIGARDVKLQVELADMLKFRQPCACIDDEGRLPWEGQQFSPTPAAAQACHLENPSQAKGGSDFHDNN
jgi:hypothetical protein